MALVNEGKAITTRRGIKGPGEVVSVKDFPSKEVYDDLIQKGFISEAGVQPKPQPQQEAKQPEKPAEQPAEPEKKAEKKSKK